MFPEHAYDRRRESDDRAASIIAAMGSRPPRTVLDVGAHMCGMSRRLAGAWPAARVVAVDRMRMPDVPGVHTVRRNIEPGTLTDLGQHELVLALSLLHHVPRWREVLAELRAAATRALIIEVPDPREHLPAAAVVDDDLHAAVADLRGRVIGTSPGYDPRYRRELVMVPS